MSASARQKSAVFTVLLGGYETLNEAQNVGDGSVDFLCFTDDETLTSALWDIRLVTPMFARDLQRSQREIKIRGHSDLDAYDRTLYIDNSVSLTAPPEAILDSWLAEHDLASPLHSFRPTVLDEFLAVVEIGLDEPARVYEQIYHYSETDAAVLDERPLWNALIARNNTPAVHVAMNRWFDEVLRYSRRDQLSSNRILGAADLRFNRVDIDNHSSALHHWPAPVNRLEMVKRQAQIRVEPDLVRIRQLESLLARQIDLADLRERELLAMKETGSWRLAERISGVLSMFRPRRGSAGKQ
jgi:hypothetical protein